METETNRNTGVVKRKRLFSYDYNAYLYLLPAFLFLIVFVYYGMFINITTSFYKWNGISTDKVFIGLKNYIDLFHDSIFLSSMVHTAIYFIVSIPIQMILGFFIAICLDTKVIGKGIVRSLIFLPNIMSMVVIAVIFSGLYNYNNGFLNETLRAIGLKSLALDWVGNPKIVLYSVIAANVYVYVGFSMTLYITGIIGIPQDVLEAAKIDGAGFWRTIFDVILPLLRGVHSSLIILGIVGSLKTFDIVWLITGGGPARASEVVSTFLYKSYIIEYKAGYSSAISVVVMVVALLLVLIQMKTSKKLDY